MRFVSATSVLCALHVVRTIVETDAAVGVDRDAVVGGGQILRHRPASRRRATPTLVRPQRNPRHDGLRHDAVGPPLRLNLPERVGRRRPAQIEVVDRHRLLEHGRVLPERMKPLHHRRKVRHVARADEAGGVREPVRMLVACRSQQQRGGVDGAARDDHERRVHADVVAAALDLDRFDSTAGGIGEQPLGACALVHSVTLGRCSAGRTQQTSASLFACSLHANELQVLQRMQPSSSPGRSSPSGSGDG